jgi:hypothetical protein
MRLSELSQVTKSKSFQDFPSHQLAQHSTRSRRVRVVIKFFQKWLGSAPATISGCVYMG